MYFRLAPPVTLFNGLYVDFKIELVTSGKTFPANVLSKYKIGDCMPTECNWCVLLRPIVVHLDVPSTSDGVVLRWDKRVLGILLKPFLDYATFSIFS